MVLISIFVMMVIGLFMFFAPEKSVKAEFKNNQEQIKKTKRNGLILTILCLVFLLLKIFI